MPSLVKQHGWWIARTGITLAPHVFQSVVSLTYFFSGWSSKPKISDIMPTHSGIPRSKFPGHQRKNKNLPSSAAAFSPPVLFGLLNDNLEWYCLEAWGRGERFLGSWQRAGRLHKGHQHSLNQRVRGIWKGDGSSFRYKEKEGGTIEQLSKNWALWKCFLKCVRGWNVRRDLYIKQTLWIEHWYVGLAVCSPLNWSLSQCIEPAFRAAIRSEIVILIMTAWRSVET